MHFVVSNFQIIWAYYRCGESGHITRNGYNSNAYIATGFVRKQYNV